MPLGRTVLAGRSCALPRAPLSHGAPTLAMQLRSCHSRNGANDDRCGHVGGALAAPGGIAAPAALSVLPRQQCPALAQPLALQSLAHCSSSGAQAIVAAALTDAKNATLTSLQ